MRRRALELAAAVSRPLRVRAGVRRHRRAIAPLLDDPTLCRRIHEGGELPAALGPALSERVVEYPWTFGGPLRGAVLDAGGTLNHDWVIARLPAAVDRLVVSTLAPEDEVADPRVSYRWADLREIPIADAAFDVAVCLSTLEHVGMDNRGYGIGGGPAPDRGPEVARVMRELRRVLRPGGTALISVPFGEPEVVGSMRQFDDTSLEAMIAAFGEARVTRAHFRYDESGWRRCSAGEAAGARYRDRFREPRAADRAQAARALACVRLDV